MNQLLTKLTKTINWKTKPKPCDNWGIKQLKQNRLINIVRKGKKKKERLEKKISIEVDK